MENTKFQPGQSGNPEGRPKGSLNRSTKLLEMLDDDLDALVVVAKEQALKGDMTAMRLLFERALPVRKAVAPAFELPELEHAESLTGKAKAVLTGVARGEIPPDIATQLISAIGVLAKVIEIDELTERLEALEKVHENQT
jgi:hypothetical protein